MLRTLVLGNGLVDPPLQDPLRTAAQSRFTTAANRVTALLVDAQRATHRQTCLPPPDRTGYRHRRLEARREGQDQASLAHEALRMAA